MSTAFMNSTNITTNKLDLHHHDADSDSGASENHRPYVPKYSVKDESLLMKVNLKSIESVNQVFFPEHYKMGQQHWLQVPKHILGLDTDFSFVVKKLEEFRELSPEEQHQERLRWDRMNRWERNMYEDRIAIISQQRLLLEQNKAGTGEVLLNRSLNPNKRSYTKFQTQQPQAQQQAQTVLFLDQPSVSQQQVVNYAEVPDSKRRCVQLKPPVPSRYQGDIAVDKDLPVPEFVSLMNFPPLNLPDNLRCCVMCGQACPSSAAIKSKGAVRTGKSNQELAFIPTQNKGLCTLCDVNVWVIAKTGMEIKWCKGCKNFRCWAAFGEKGHATKCLRCRDRQREKYAAQKVAKERKASRGGSSSVGSPH